MIKPSVIIFLIVLAAIMAAGIFMFKGDRPAPKTAERIGGRILKDAVLGEKLNAIDIKKGSVSVRLEKKDKTQWVMPSHNNRPAKMDRIDQLVMDAGTAKIETIREGDLDTFGLDEKGVTQLTFNCGETKYSLLVGKSPDFSKSFVRTDASSGIYEVDRGLDMSSGVRTEKDDRVLDPSYFYDLKLMGMPADSIIDISIKKGDKTVRVQKGIVDKGLIEPNKEIPKDAKFEWVITEPEKQPADENAVSRITNQFITFNMKKYADGVTDKDAGLDAPAATVTIRTKDGAEHVLSFGKIDGDDVYLAIKGRNDKFLTYKFAYDNIVLSLDDLKKKEAPKADIETPKPAPKPDFKGNLTPEEKEKIKKEVEAQMPKPAPKPKSDAPPPPPPPPAPPATDKATGGEPKAPPAVIKDEEKK